MKSWCVLLLLSAGCWKGSLEQAAPDTTMPAAEAGIAESAAVAAPDADASVDVASQPLACANGSAETEPNDVMTAATPLVMGRNCGVGALGDVDFFALSIADGARLRVEAASDDVEFALVDEDGRVDVKLSTEARVDFQSSALRAFIRVTAKSKQSYAIIRE